MLGFNYPLHFRSFWSTDNSIRFSPGYVNESSIIGQLKCDIPASRLIYFCFLHFYETQLKILLPLNCNAANFSPKKKHPPFISIHSIKKKTGKQKKKVELKHFEHKNFWLIKFERCCFFYLIEFDRFSASNCRMLIAKHSKSARLFLKKKKFFLIKKSNKLDKKLRENVTQFNFTCHDFGRSNERCQFLMNQTSRNEPEEDERRGGWRKKVGQRRRKCQLVIGGNSRTSRSSSGSIDDRTHTSHRKSRRSILSRRVEMQITTTRAPWQPSRSTRLNMTFGLIYAATAIIR